MTVFNSRELSNSQLDWLREKLNKQEIRDYLDGCTDLDILLDPDDLEEYTQKFKPNSVKFIEEN